MQYQSYQTYKFMKMEANNHFEFHITYITEYTLKRALTLSFSQGLWT